MIARPTKTPEGLCRRKAPAPAIVAEDVATFVEDVTIFAEAVAIVVDVAIFVYAYMLPIFQNGGWPCTALRAQ